MEGHEEESGAGRPVVPHAHRAEQPRAGAAALGSAVSGRGLSLCILPSVLWWVEIWNKHVSFLSFPV